MVNDLLELNDTALKLDKEWILDDKDAFWLENKYWHWKDVLGQFQIFINIDRCRQNSCQP